MGEFYKSYYIHTVFDLSLDSDCWIPKAEIVWEEQGIQRHQQLTGPHDRFKIIEDAEIHAVEMAMAWIDVQLMQRRDAVTDLNQNLESGLREQSISTLVNQNR